MPAPHPEEFAGLSRTEILRASPTMFDTKWLDRCSRVHWTVPLIIFLPVVIALLVLGFVNHVGVIAIAWIAAGYAIWSMTEYWLHRVVFHFDPGKGIGGRLHWIMHGVHHDHPNDPKRLVMPPSVSVPLAILFVAAFWAIFGSPAFWTLSAGFLGGYLGYDMLHYHVHHRRATTRLGKWMRELHMRHHFQDGHTAYGVSAPYWDYVFHTAVKHRLHGPR